MQFILWALHFRKDNKKERNTMKKTLALLFLILVFVMTLTLGFVVPSAAAQDAIRRKYSYSDTAEDYGKTDGLRKHPTYHSYNSAGGFFFCDGAWTYEYYNPAEGKFYPMTAYYSDGYIGSAGWTQGSWNNFYTAYDKCAWEQSGYSNCSVLGWRQMSPGKEGGAAVTFIAPASGTISYEASLFAISESNTPHNMGNKWGSLIYIYVNDTQVYPAAGDMSGMNRIGYHNTSKIQPMEFQIPSYRVKKGDKIRLLVMAYGGDNTSKNVYFADVPLVQYLSADAPFIVEAPKVLDCDFNKENTSIKVSWSTVSDVIGYNVYLKPANLDSLVKVNAIPIRDDECILMGLEPSTMYEVAVTAVSSSGVESELSECYLFKTKNLPKQDPSISTDSSGQGSSNDTENSETPNNSSSQNNSGVSSSARPDTNISTDTQTPVDSSTQSNPDPVDPLVSDSDPDGTTSDTDPNTEQNSVTVISTGPASEGSASSDQPKRSSFPLGIAIASGVVVLITIGFTVWYFGFFKKK